MGGGVVLSKSMRLNRKEQRTLLSLIHICNGTKDEEMVLKVGDTVLYGKYAGTELEVEGTKYLIMQMCIRDRSKTAFPALILLATIFFIQHHATITGQFGKLGLCISILILLAMGCLLYTSDRSTGVANSSTTRLWRWKRKKV